MAAVPIVGPGFSRLLGLLKPRRFKSGSYWEERYRDDGNSGAGSYGRLAQFKADVINRFVNEHAVTSIIEFGCGDGAQLTLARYPRYTGIDVSSEAVALCARKFSGDKTKQFFDLESREADTLRADLALSLDVVYHLVEDDVYDAYMRRLVTAAERFICIYSSNDDLPGPAVHIRHRRFTDWMVAHAGEWRLLRKIPNAFPYDSASPDETSWADFYFFARA
jgi:SAM-dependent methyltransferase